ncbi:MAG: TolC family protein [Bacteroidota bacterium]
MRSKLKLCFVLLLIGFIRIAAQDQNAPFVISLDDAIKLALEKNWDVKLSEKDILRADEQISEAYANAFPRLEFNGRYVRNIKLPVLFLPSGTPFNESGKTMTLELGSDNAYDLTFSLSQVIYSQKVNTAIQIADEYSELSKTANLSTRNDIILNVKKAFYNVLLMQELVKVSRQGNEVAKANYENVSALFKQGVASEYDFLRAEVQFANTQPMLIQTENNLELAKNYLKNILTLDITQPIEIRGEFVFEEVPGSLLESANEKGVREHPLVKQLEIQSSLLDKNITIQRADYFPTLAAFGSYAFQAQDNTFNFKDYLWAESFMVGLNLSYTLFDGFGRSARIEQAIIDKEKVDLTRRKVEEGLKIRIMQAKMSMDEAKKRIDAQTKSLEQADKALKIAQTRYKSGVGTQLELIDTQAAMTIARTNYAQAIYDYLTAKADWENAVSIEY